MLAKDVHNAIARIEKDTRTLSEANAVRQQLTELKSSSPDVFVNVSNLSTPATQCIVVVTPEMKASLRSAPSILFVDATYTVNREIYAMYVMMVQDAYGLAQVCPKGHL